MGQRSLENITELNHHNDHGDGLRNANAAENETDNQHFVDLLCSLWLYYTGFVVP